MRDGVRAAPAHAAIYRPYNILPLSSDGERGGA